jgi:hypothetical protein
VFFCVPYGDQDFPLNDDWAYALGAFKFARGEGIEYFGWCGMPLLGMWEWAYPTIQLLEISKGALRLSTIVLSWFGAMAFFDLLRQSGLRPALAAFGAVTLIFNPLYFLMSNTFMSDMPALSFSLLALACYKRGFEGCGRGWYMVAGCFAATLAAVTRQNALAVPVVAAVLLLQRPRVEWRAFSWSTIAIPAIACLATSAWFVNRVDVLPVAPRRPDLERVLTMTVPVLVSVGLARIPAVLLIGRRCGQPLRALCMVSLGTAAWVGYNSIGFKRGLFDAGFFPFFSNVLTSCGAIGQEVNLGVWPVLLDEPRRVGLTGLGITGAAFLLARLFAVP